MYFIIISLELWIIKWLTICVLTASIYVILLRVISIQKQPSNEQVFNDCILKAQNFSNVLPFMGLHAIFPYDKKKIKIFHYYFLNAAYLLALMKRWFYTCFLQTMKFDVFTAKVLQKSLPVLED